MAIVVSTFQDLFCMLGMLQVFTLLIESNGNSGEYFPRPFLYARNAAGIYITN